MLIFVSRLRAASIPASNETLKTTVSADLAGALSSATPMPAPNFNENALFCLILS